MTRKSWMFVGSTRKLSGIFRTSDLPFPLPERFFGTRISAFVENPERLFDQEERNMSGDGRKVAVV